MLSSIGPLRPPALLAATTALRHRGPNGQRHWISPDGRAGLGHARLSIIDLETGDQPIANEDGRVHVVVNGEFYDHERMFTELEQRGHRFRTRSDSEIVLHLYEDLGTECLAWLRGEFAFALWDERAGLLFAARDRFGIKPLHYARRHGTLYLASEAKALIAAGIPARWDQESVYQDLHAVADGDRSLFRDIHQLAPAHFLLATRDDLRVVRYWDLAYDERSTLSDEEHVLQLRHELREATRLRLRADVPVACYLSGGIDSGALVGMAQSLRPEPIQTFTIQFDDDPLDESGVAEAMARASGSRFERVRISEDALADHFDDAIAQCETLSHNATCVAKYLLSRHVRDRGFKVVLTGEGADEIFAGYPPFRRDQLLHAHGDDPRALRRRIADLLKASDDVARLMLPIGDTLPLDRVRQALGHVPSWIETLAAHGKNLRPLLHRDFLAAFAARDPYQAMLDAVNRYPHAWPADPVRQSMDLWCRTILPNKTLNYLADRVEMAHAVEGRPPFLDHHVVDVASRMPLPLLIRGTTEKYVLREAARPFVTDAVHCRPKHPFSPPLALKGKLHQLVQDTLRSEHLAAVPFFDHAAIVRLLDRVAQWNTRTHIASVMSVLTTALSACALQRRYAL